MPETKSEPGRQTKRQLDSYITIQHKISTSPYLIQSSSVKLWGCASNYYFIPYKWHKVCSQAAVTEMNVPTLQGQAHVYIPAA